MASTASLVARSPQSPRSSRSMSEAVSRAVMRFSLPHLAASKSYIFRANRLSAQPHSRNRWLTRSSPKRSTRRFVAVLSETMIDSIARSRRDTASTSRICRSTPVPSTRSPTPSAPATSARPKFELATFMYALQTKGKIRIAVLDKAIPFAVHDSSGLRTGFEVDLGRELAKAIFGPRQDPDSVIEWIPVERTTAVSALISAQADLTLAQLAAPESGTGFDSPVDLSDPYFVTGERILIKSSNDEIKDLPDLDTKTVCVQGDTAVAPHLPRAIRCPVAAAPRPCPPVPRRPHSGHAGAVSPAERVPRKPA